VNADVKAKWLAALRSGEYKQTQGVLAHTFFSEGENGEVTGYCCLGVLCDLAVKDGVIPPPVKDYGGDWKYGAFDRVLYDEGDYKEYDTSETGLPMTVREWAGLDVSDEDPKWTDPTPDEPSNYTLAGANDSGKTFAEIADIIEEHL
jgi:hypothetical protein